MAQLIAALVACGASTQDEDCIVYLPNGYIRVCATGNAYVFNAADDEIWAGSL